MTVHPLRSTESIRAWQPSADEVEVGPPEPEPDCESHQARRHRPDRTFDLRQPVDHSDNYLAEKKFFRLSLYYLFLHFVALLLDAAIRGLLA